MSNQNKGQSTAEIANNYRVLQTQYLADIDCSGGMYLEHQEVEHKNKQN